MSKVLSELLELLQLEAIEENLFRGKCQDLGFKSVFGGQVIGQALMAATRTVQERTCHSLHGYFLRPGDPSRPIVYDVDRIRDGKSFTTRRVVAIQHGRPIFNMSVSFQVREEGYSHQVPMPQVEEPDGLMSDLERIRAIADKIPERLRQKFTCDRPIEFRTINPQDPFRPEKRDAKKSMWLRTNGGMPDDHDAHICLLAYASDFSLLGTSLLPHGVSFAKKGLQMASLDHAMWFHRPFRLDDWVLYTTDSPSSGFARGFNRGQFFDRDGNLIASVAQEGLIRQRED